MLFTTFLCTAKDSSKDVLVKALGSGKESVVVLDGGKRLFIPANALERIAKIK